MIVVSDTSPLNYLVLVRCDHVLPELFGRVLAPPAVMSELRHPHSPAAVRGWAEKPPVWLEIRSPTAVDPELKLGPGEAQALCLARELHADTVLIDERKASRLARQMGLLVTGTLGVLVTASQKGLIRLADAFNALPPIFRAPESLLRKLLEQALQWEHRRPLSPDTAPPRQD
jgi:predicted nucleic acid-binding protein